MASSPRPLGQHTTFRLGMGHVVMETRADLWDELWGLKKRGHMFRIKGTFKVALWWWWRDSRSVSACWNNMKNLTVFGPTHGWNCALHALELK